jgi:hypothetical protein
VALVFAALLIAAMVALEKARPWQDDLGPDVDGLPEK